MRTLLIVNLLVFIAQVRSIETTGEASCDSGQCNQACINVGWSGGCCKTGSCWCWKTQESGVRNEKTLKELQSTKSGKQSCDDSRCNAQCVLLGNFGGTCSGDCCICFGIGQSRINNEKALTKLKREASCGSGECNQACINFGWREGYCLLGFCWCYHYSQQSGVRNEKTLKELKSNQFDVASCDRSQCNRNCTNIGWRGGYCKLGICWCDVSSQQPDVRIEKALTDLKSTQLAMPPGCSPSCIQECGHIPRCCDKGICLSHESYRNTSWQLLHEIPTNYRDKAGNEVASCTDRKTCFDTCVSLGAINGLCMKNLCWCSIHNKTSTTSRNLRPVIELQSNLSDALTNEDTCNPSDCRRHCNNNQKTVGAACMYGYCWCKSPKKIDRTPVQQSVPAAVRNQEKEVA